MAWIRSACALAGAAVALAGCGASGTTDRLLADSIPGAKLILYPDVGHAFLFQDLASFLLAVQRFLA